MGGVQNAQHEAKSDISGLPREAGGVPATWADPRATEKIRFLELSPYESDGGHLIGKDPREMTADDWAGRERLVGLKAVRAKCMDCSAGQPSEIRKCTVSGCALWPLRMGCIPSTWRNESGA